LLCGGQPSRSASRSPFPSFAKLRLGW
jgi:hypothetical protein